MQLLPMSGCERLAGQHHDQAKAVLYREAAGGNALWRYLEDNEHTPAATKASLPAVALLNNGYKLLRLGSREELFTTGTISHLNNLPRDRMESSKLDTSKIQLERVLGHCADRGLAEKD